MIDTIRSIRLKATFDAQAWVNDYALSVGPLGDATWDCTSHFRRHFGEKELQEIQEVGAFIDEDDVLLDDPAAPEWIREWNGPFTITVEECHIGR